MNLVDVRCPDCEELLRVNIDNRPGHCPYCGRLIKVNPETLEVEPGKGEEEDVILTQYEALRKKQKFGEQRKSQIKNDNKE